MLRILDTWLKALQNNRLGKEFTQGNPSISQATVRFIDQNGDKNLKALETNTDSTRNLDEKKSSETSERLVDLELLKQE